ncbi:MAG: DUF4349 domain-containing protein [Anaerolineae bacterium]|nr:DUF4349 domain-containing protein [Anaerolineae bacterium]
MTFKQAIPLIFAILLLVACGGMAAEESMYAPEAAMEFAAAETAADSADGVAYSETVLNSGEALNTQTELPQQRLIIRTADMAIVVADTEAAMKTIAQMVEENGGWVVSSSVYQYSDTAMTGDITVRVPAEGFTSATEAVRGIALEVQHESTSGQDVTEEFVDLSSRLENLESTAARVRSFLDETKTVEEALAVNQELSRLEGEIEVIKGRMKYLSQSAAFSTIAVHLTPDEASRPVEVAGWRPDGVAKDALESLIGFLQFLVEATIWIVIFLLPVVIILGIPIWLVVRFVRRRRRNRKDEQLAVNSEQSAMDKTEETKE